MIILYYTNGSTITKTFHGVTFGPGETKEVFGIINDPKFVLSSTRQEPPKCDGGDGSISDDASDPVKKVRRGRKSSNLDPSKPVEVATADDTDDQVSSDIDTAEVDTTT